jgi:FemAB-related protein (PEP-CTERM system-associated)
VTTAPGVLGAAAAAVLTDRVERAEWDAFVRRDEGSSFCHLWAWREVIGGVMGQEPLFRAMRRPTGEIAGVLPLYRLRSRVFGTHLVSVPFMNYGGPLGDDAARHTLTQWALEEARRIRARSLLLRTRRPVPGVAATASKVTVVLPLGADADQMWTKSFDAKFRNKIKRPQRDGMTTEFGAAHFNGFYTVLAQNMRDLGTPVLPRQFFEQIMAGLPEHVLVGVTYLEGRAVAGGFGFIWRDEFEMTWSSSLKELRASKPNMLLYWDYMRELIGRGVRRFNFGRSTPGSGPHEFKLSWGGVDETLPWVQWPDSGNASSDSRAATIAASVWRHMPIRITNVLGPSLARQLPWW